MRHRKRFLQLTPILLVLLIGGLTISPLTVVQGAPQPQLTAPPRPTAPPPGATPQATTPPSPGGPIDIDSKITLSLIVDKAEAHPGDQLVYKAQIANVAGKEATNVWLSCQLSEGILVEETTTTLGEIHNYGQQISFELGRLPPSFDSQFVTIKARIREDVEPGTELVHHANLTSDQAGGGERSVSTLVLGDEPPEWEGLPLPVTGGGTVSLWIGVAFLAIAGGVALYSVRERSHPPG
jgi:uncharacterized repeat protein (TIGR01451 family)